MKRLQTKRAKIFLSIAVLLLIGGMYVLFNRSDSTAPEQAVTESEREVDGDTPPTDNSDFRDPNEVEKPNEDEPTKQPGPAIVNVLEKPVVYTGYGNSKSSPLGLNQQTSTLCTTDANVECVITFRNISSSEEVTFEAMTTDSSGVVRWSWKGSDVGSGTWEVIGTAGDETSDTGTLYIK